MPTLLHPEDHAFHRMVAAFEGEAEPWLAVNRALRDALVAYAGERSPYYRAILEPGRDFESLPILTKEGVRANFQGLLAEGVPKDRWAEGRTSGSTGTPMPFVRDTSQGPLENVSAQRFLRWMQGIPPDATTVWVASRPVGMASGRRFLGRRPDPEVHPVPTLELTPRRLEREIRVWTRFRSWFLYGHASAIGWIVEEARDRGYELTGLQAVVTTSDMLTHHGARRLASSLGVPVHSWYGSNEMNGFLAGTLPGERRYAFNPLLVHVEVVDDAGRRVEPGQSGRLVLTDLNNLVMPFIRYDSSDLAISSGTTVGGFPIVEEIVGRESEILRLPSGRVLSGVTLGQTLFVLNDFVEDIARYQLARTGEREVELRVVWARPPSAEVRTGVQRALEAAVGVDTRARIRDVRELGVLPSGKTWIVRDETPTGAGAP
jgi:phenylacetate-CoA ligase